MKLLVDEVFVHGFVHGTTVKLGGKKILLFFTTGASEMAYTISGFFGHTIEEYLSWFKTTAALCNLEYVGAIFTNGVRYVDWDDEEKGLYKNILLANMLLALMMREELQLLQKHVAEVMEGKLRC